MTTFFIHKTVAEVYVLFCVFVSFTFEVLLGHFCHIPGSSDTFAHPVCIKTKAIVRKVLPKAPKEPYPKIVSLLLTRFGSHVFMCLLLFVYDVFSVTFVEAIFLHRLWDPDFLNIDISPECNQPTPVDLRFGVIWESSWNDFAA